MDILCQAKSGMGKTAVFVLATLQQIEPVDGQVGSGDSESNTGDAMDTHGRLSRAHTAGFPTKG